MLGLEYAGIVHADRNVEVVEMMLDAKQQYEKPFDEARIIGWHASFFPTGYSGMHQITIGSYSDEKMQVVSDAMGKEKVHFQAPAPSTMKAEMDAFLG